MQLHLVVHAHGTPPPAGRRRRSPGRPSAPPQTQASPMPLLIFGDSRKGWPNCSGCSSIQTLSSFCHSVSGPSMRRRVLDDGGEGGGCPARRRRRADGVRPRAGGRADRARRRLAESRRRSAPAAAGRRLARRRACRSRLPLCAGSCAQREQQRGQGQGGDDGQQAQCEGVRSASRTAPSTAATAPAMGTHPARQSPAVLPAPAAVRRAAPAFSGSA